MIDEQELAEFILSIIESPNLQIPANHAGVMVEAQAWMRGFASGGSQLSPLSPLEAVGRILDGQTPAQGRGGTESSPAASDNAPVDVSIGGPQ